MPVLSQHVRLTNLTVPGCGRKPNPWGPSSGPGGERGRALLAGPATMNLSVALGRVRGAGPRTWGDHAGPTLQSRGHQVILPYTSLVELSICRNFHTFHKQETPRDGGKHGYLRNQICLDNHSG